jgi:hypothetical protein
LLIFRKFRDGILNFCNCSHSWSLGETAHDFKLTGLATQRHSAASACPCQAGFAGGWFRHEKPLRFRAGPAGAAQAFMDCGDMSPLSKRRHVGALQRRTRAGMELNRRQRRKTSPAFGDC